MMTSRLAFSYNREVYALPGRVDDICSQGCNMLIRTKMAEPIVSAEALNDSLRLNSCGNQRKASHADTLYGIYGNTQSNETLGLLLHITDLIGKERGITLDEMTFRTGLEYAAVSHLTGLLESEGLISIDILQRCSLEAGKFR
jgi:DNA processing protein